MKKITIWAMLVVLMLSVVGCRKPTRVYDPDEIKAGSASSCETSCEYPIDPILPTYSAVMEKVGKNGMVVAGYSTGKREQFRESKWSGYTDTTFVVTDTYYGKAAETVKVRELYFLMKDEFGNDVYYDMPKNKVAILRNNVQSLLFLYREQDGSYRMVCDFIPLMPDYRDYNDAYVESLCDFYRGDSSVYISENGEWRNQYETIYIDPKTGKVSAGPSTTIDRVHFWPKQEASNQEILEQFQENMVVRSATEFKISIWPYGHKNYDNKDFPTTLRELMAYSSYGVAERWFREVEQE